MREKGNDELSALMDGEATELEMHRVLRSAVEDPEVAAKWQRYHLASAILRKETRPCSASHLAGIDLASRVSAALQEEPALHVAAEPLAARASWWKPLANVAIAASVATVVVVGWQQASTPAKPAEAAPQVAAAGQATAVASLPSVMPVQNAGVLPVAQSYGVVPASASAQRDYVRSQKLDEQRFNHYLISHSGNAAFANHGGQLPYVRVVTLKPDTAQH